MALVYDHYPFEQAYTSTVFHKDYSRFLTPVDIEVTLKLALRKHYHRIVQELLLNIHNACLI